MRRIQALIYGLIFGFTIVISSCNTAMIYNQTEDIEGTWNRYDSAVFHVPIEDTAALYNFYINIRNNNDYRYSNLYVFFHSIFPNGNKTHDTLEFILADKRGKWLGKGIGEIKENNILIRKNMRFPVQGEYTFKIEQGMRSDDLKGIEDIGISIEKSN